VNISGGPPGHVFEGRTFLDAYPIPRTNLAIGVERDRNLAGRRAYNAWSCSRKTIAKLATLDSYEGGIIVSPSAKKVAYFIDKEVLEVRDLVDLGKVARLRIAWARFNGRPTRRAIFAETCAGEKIRRTGLDRHPAARQERKGPGDTGNAAGVSFRSCTA